ncbi:TonB family protein [Roseinatronobacter alkalisoli]|uniref:TonB family protein n=1 Tax=Roseinatronobacter alkalisoli TaxID=3028235 RepID=A0ABT5T6I2_9RHOB|nr:TonB family protein [Roseinatronobacter sp. HJB301]MDD7969842.1 TonB family protein [Roseinatronobacter sp. HJB301]
MTAAAVFRACPKVNGCPFVTTRHLRALDLRPKARTIALALLVSMGLHLGAVAAFGPQGAVVMTEGGGEAAPAALGTSFEDFAIGSSEPAPMTEAQLPDAAQPTTPPQQTAPVMPAQSMPHVPAARVPDQIMQPVLTAQTPEDAVLPQVVDPAVIPEIVPPSLSESAPAQRADTMETHRPAPVAPVEQVRATTSPDTSPRPPARPPELTTPPSPAPQQVAAAPAAPRGNARQNAQRGAQQGTDGQAANTATARPAATQAGNAAVSSYPGEVMRRIQRVRQVRSPARGQVVVAFGIAADGGLASASIARTSGNAGLDQAALDHIRRAAPFPAPPAGAQQQFNFEFVGR